MNWAVGIALTLVVIGAGCSGTSSPAADTTASPTSASPTTAPANNEAPVTEAPVTEATTTLAPLEITVAESETTTVEVEVSVLSTAAEDEPTSAIATPEAGASRRLVFAESQQILVPGDDPVESELRYDLMQQVELTGSGLQITTTVERAGLLTRPDGEQDLTPLLGIQLRRDLHSNGVADQATGYLGVSPEVLGEDQGAIAAGLLVAVDDLVSFAPPLGLELAPGVSWQVTSDASALSGLAGQSVAVLTVTEVSDSGIEASLDRTITFEPGEIELNGETLSLNASSQANSSGIISWGDGFPLPLVTIDSLTDLAVQRRESSELEYIRINQNQEIALR